ncbi:hypothetical protein JTB14_002696 [Gonioctena quinquepunctata]|nr:hypothetical protein JTB14_002696 [Gonioctena quinquepunctata]
MSHTAAATIEAFIGSGSEQLPAEAIYTAEFIKDTDSLFDSLNAQNPKLTLGEPASLREETHSGWVPSINMGYEINHGNSHVCDRYKRLQVFHMDKLDMVVC